MTGEERLVSNVTPTGADLIAAERRRQVDVEGWTPEHDAMHTQYELTMAAQCYLAAAREGGAGWIWRHVRPPLFPWAESYWKPSDEPIRNLVKSGALIAAEIDRLQAIPGEADQDIEGDAEAYAWWRSQQ